MHTSEGNKIVAEYAGLPKVGNTGEYYKNWNSAHYDQNNLIFHKSFDWQIPVWAKVMQQDRYEIINRFSHDYHAAIDTNNPLAAFNILVSAIQFLKK
jgi:hypothetical protein